MHRTLGTLLATALLLIGSACSDYPNDPLVALVCDDGYILNSAQNGCLPATNVVVHGTVTDALSGRPIAGAAVTVYPFGEQPVNTDANGYYSVRGVVGDDDLVVVISAAGYQIWRGAVDDTGDAFNGVLVMTVNASLNLELLRLRVAGTVYAGDHAAGGALVELRSASSMSSGTLRTTALADGRFEFNDVYDGSYTVQVYPYDDDGDGIADYRYFTLNIGQLSTNTTYNISNLVLALSTITKQLLYTNLLGLSMPRTVQNIVHTGMQLGNPTDNLLFHFGSEADTDYFEVELRPWDNWGGYGEPLPLALTWTLGDSVLTIDPLVELAADANPNTGYELRFLSFRWADGTVALPQTDPVGFMGFRFDISASGQTLASPTPAFYIDNKVSASQTTAEVSCDSLVCWLLDQDAYYFGGFADPFGAGAASAYFNTASGLQLAWTHVPAADSYRLYVRQRNDRISSPQLGNWFRGTGALESIDVGGGPDPAGNPLVLSANALATGGAYSDWSDFDLTGAGPLAFGTELDIAVTAVDADGFESPIDALGALTVRDETPAALRDAAYAFAAGSGIQAPTTELGARGLLTTVRLAFTEYMDTTITPLLAAHSGMITSLAASGPTSWDQAEILTPENVSAAAVIGPLAFDVRGACTPITCLAEYNPIQPSLSHNAVCVHDASLFGTGQVFFVNADGSHYAWSLTLASVDQANDMLYFTSTVSATLDPANGTFACAVNSGAGNATTLAVVANPGDAVLRVANASVFAAGQDVMVYNPANGDGFTATLLGVTTSTTPQRLHIAPGVGLGTYPATQTVVIPRPRDSEYSLRPASRPTVRDVATASGTSVTIPFTASLAASPVMVGDLVLVDVDGAPFSVADRYFGTVTAVTMEPDDPGTPAADETSYRLAVGAPPAGLPAIPAGTLIKRTVSVVVTLGDVIEVLNGLATHATPLADTSGNLGLHERRMRFGVCNAAGVPGYCASNGALIF